MPLPTDVTVDIDSPPVRGVDHLTQFNNLVTDFRALQTKFNAVCAKLDADAGVTDTNYSALQSLPDASLVTAKLKRHG